MNKLLFTVCATALLCVPVLANAEVKSKTPAKAQTAVNASAKPAEQKTIDAIIAKVSAAVKSGNEAEVKKILAESVEQNPDLAAKIIAAFVASAATESANAKTAAVNVGAIVSEVAKNVQTKQGGEKLAAEVLSAYTPAAGNPSTAANANAGNTAPVRVPPALPRANRANVPTSLPVENPNVNSPR